MGEWRKRNDNEGLGFVVVYICGPNSEASKIRMGVGVGKAWRFGLLSTNLALLPPQPNNNNKRKQQHVCWTTTTTPFQQRKTTISWSVVCGLMLFVLGLISLLTGHMASDLEWYSQRLVHPTFYSRIVTFPSLFFLTSSSQNHTHTHTHSVKVKILIIGCSVCRKGVTVRQLMFGNHSILNTTMDAVTGDAILLVSFFLHLTICC